MISITVIKFWTTHTTAIVTLEQINKKSVLVTFSDYVTRDIKASSNMLSMLTEGKEYTINFETNVFGISYLESFK